MLREVTPSWNMDPISGVGKQAFRAAQTAHHLLWRLSWSGKSDRKPRLLKNFNYKLNDKPPKLCYDIINRQTEPNSGKGDADMKTMTSANFCYECEQAVFQSEEYSYREVRPYQDKQQLAGSST